MTENAPFTARDSALPPVLIGVPVYRGLDETRRCLESVLAAGLPARASLFVLNDASPDPALAGWLRSWCTEQGVTLEESAVNRGFVGSANRICEVAGQRDVILLNADTAVSGDWIDRLAQAATSREGVATVTPWSNNATLVSYPEAWRVNPWPADPAGLDAACRAANGGRTEVLPVGVGFCLYLCRAALQRVGRFADTAFGRGYGEEVDFCLRASALGLVHLLAADTFVAHAGEVSFGEDAEAARREAEARLLDRHPGFPALIDAFRKDDSLAAARERITRMRLALMPAPRILMVSHAWDGGVWQHVEALATLLAGRAEVLSLRPAAAGRMTLIWLRPDESWALDLPATPEDLLPVLRDIGISRVHVHHLRDHVFPMETLAAALGAPLDVTLHDYHLLSDNYQLIDADGRFSETLVDVTAPAFVRGRRLLEAATRIIAPSRDVAERHARFIPGAPYEVQAHPEQPAGRGPRPLRVGVLGALSHAKGLGRLEAAARQARATGQPLHFVLIGYAVEPVATWPECPLEIRGEYTPAELPARIAAEGLDVMWFPACWPETYSYTLSAALDAGLRIVAPRLGAFSERLAGHPLAWLHPVDAPLEAVMAGLVQAAGLVGEAPRRTDNRDEYLRRYLAPLEPFARSSPPTLSSLPDLALGGSDAHSAPADLLTLFENGINRGHRRSVDQLRVEVARLEGVEREALAAAAHLAARETHVEELGRAIEAFKDECKRLESEAQTQHAAALQVQRELKDSLRQANTEIAFHRRRVEDLESSTSWRVTAPLRAAGAAIKRLRQRIGRVRALFELSGRRVAIAWDILRQQGPGALARRVRARLGQGRPVVQPETWKYRLAEHLAPLAVPQAESPRVTIVIPVHGQHQHTFSCLKSIVEHTRLPIEVIVIDDVSPIPVVDALHPVSGLRIFRNAENQGFIRNCNLGVREARAPYVVLLNNDTLVTPGWLEALLRPLEQDERVGVVGAKLIYPDGRLQEAGGILWRDGSAWNYGRGDEASRAEFNYVREVDYVSGACFAVRRADFLASGGFDEAFAPAYCEDSDYCLRAASRGQKVIYQPACTIVHFEGVSNGTDTSGGLKAYQVRNTRLLYERWQERLAQHRPNGVLPNLERERGVQRRFLYIDATMVTPDQDSGSVRVRGVLKTAREHGCKVTFIADNLEYKSPYVEDLQQLGVEVRYWPELRSIEDYLEAEGAFFDVVVLSRYYVAEKHIAAVRRHAPQALVALDTHDLHYLRLRRLAELEPSAAHVRAAEEAYAREIAIMQSCDVTLVVSPVEQALLAREQSDLDVRVFTNIHEVADRVPPHGERSGIMFVGGYRHPPNIDAVLWYAREVLPRVKQRLPGVKTFIIGSNAPREITELADEALEVVGFVPDMTPYLERVRVSISPLRYGAGVKGKINQAMAHGLPVVGTSPSVEGMFLRDGVEVLVADSPEDFAAAIERLHTDAGLWQRLSEASLENVRTHFSADAAWRVIDGMMTDAERRRR